MKKLSILLLLSLSIISSEKSKSNWVGHSPVNFNASTWMPGIQAIPSTGTARDSQIHFNWGKAIVADSLGYLHVVWLEIFDEADSQPFLFDGQIMYSRSIDNGVNWSQPAPVSLRDATHSGWATGFPKIATAGSNVYVVWHGNPDLGPEPKVYIRVSPDNGNNWPTEAKLVATGGYLPGVASWSNDSFDTVHVVWAAREPTTGVDEIYLRSSADGWNNHQTTIREVSTHDSHSSWTPSVAAMGSLIHVAWTDERHNTTDCSTIVDKNNCREELYYRRSPDFGGTWDIELRLSEDILDPLNPNPDICSQDSLGSLESSWAPSIVAQNFDVHVSWFDRRTGNFEIYYKRSPLAGAKGSWSCDTHLSTGGQSFSDDYWRPSMAVLGNLIHILYWGNGPNNTFIYSVESSDNGNQFNAPQILYMTGSGKSINPSIAIAPDNTLHGIWFDDIDGIDQILYRTEQ